MADKNVKGLTALLGKLDKLGVEGRKGVDEITEGVISEIALDARQRAPKNLGKLQQSIIYQKVSPLTYRVTVGESYGAYVEFGTGAQVQVPLEFQEMAQRFKGRGGSFEDGLESIRDWCVKKGIPKEAAYPIFISILKKGTRPQPYLYPAFVKGRSQYFKDLQELFKRLTK